MTQLEAAKKGLITPAMLETAEYEGLDSEYILKGIANGLSLIHI